MQTGQRRAEGDPRKSMLASGAPTASWPQYPDTLVCGWAVGLIALCEKGCKERAAVSAICLKSLVLGSKAGN